MFSGKKPTKQVSASKSFVGAVDGAVPNGPSHIRDMGIDDFVPVVAAAIAKLFCTGAICAYAYKELVKTDSIQPRLLKELSHVNKQLLIPLLFFSKCSQGITGPTLVKFAFVPILVTAF